MNILPKKIFAIPIVLYWTLAACASADVTLNISGTVIASPCTTGTSDSYTFDLGQEIPVASLQTYGQTTPPKSHDIVLSNCPAGTTKVTAKFSGTPFSESTTNFKNDGDATHLGINITNGNGTITYSNGSTATVNVDASRKATFPLTVKGVTVGNTSTGSIKAAIVMSFTYN